MQKILALSIVLVLALSATTFFGTQATKAESQQNQTQDITIQPNGTIDPPNVLIQRQGEVYRLTANLNNSAITIQRGNIVVDGASYTLRESGTDQNRIAITIMASNVTIQNMQITGWKAGVYGAYDNNTITNNAFIGNYHAIAIYAYDYVVSQNNITQSTNAVFIHTGAARPQGNNNLITRNQIVENQAAFDITGSNGTILTQNNVTNNSVILTLGVITLQGRESGNHTFYQNNFVSNTEALHVPTPIFGGKGPEIFPAGYWDNGTIGNYWSNYQQIYPNASQLGDSKVWNTPYFIQDTIPYEIEDANGTVETGIAVLGTAVDHFPLRAPFQLELPIAQPTPTQTANPTPTGTASAEVPEFPAWTLLSLLAAVSAILLRKGHRESHRFGNAVPTPSIIN
ncbi:MAG: NosD domain-containing protein [Candidatus Bathyarchaeia archaeon]|jgi:hypothetical protein